MIWLACAQHRVEEGGWRKERHCLGTAKLIMTRAYSVAKRDKLLSLLVVELNACDTGMLLRHLALGEYYATLRIRDLLPSGSYYFVLAS